MIFNEKDRELLLSEGPAVTVRASWGHFDNI